MIAAARIRGCWIAPALDDAEFDAALPVDRRLERRWALALAAVRRARIGSPEFDAARSQLLAVYRAYNLTRP